jgi:hypothetical protein
MYLDCLNINDKKNLSDKHLRTCWVFHIDHSCAPCWFTSPPAPIIKTKTKIKSRTSETYAGKIYNHHTGGILYL